jgi:muramoyltetrapeptide carboxypeptidase
VIPQPFQLVRPPALVRGDSVGIVAPAGPVNRDEFENGLDGIRKLGFCPVYDPSILDRELYFAGSVARRVDELHGMFRSSAVKAIVCARGGYGANHLLPHLDLDLIAANPKILCGYSDLTTLLTYFHQRIGLIGFHGPMVAKDFARTNGVHLPSFLSATSGEQNWKLRSSDSPKLEALVTGRTEGKLYGGCLSLLVASLGTPYEVETEGTILFLEDLAEWPYRIDRMLMHLRYAGKLKGVRGIVFGEMTDCAPPASADYTLQQAIVRTIGDLGIPVAFGLSSGHVPGSNITLPFGVRARLVVEGNATLEILEAATVARVETNRVGTN